MLSLLRAMQSLPYPRWCLESEGNSEKSGDSHTRRTWTSEIWNNKKIVIIENSYSCRVGPPTTSRVTPAGVTRITPGNSGWGNSVFAVIVLPTLTLCCLHLWRHIINECLGIALHLIAFCDAFRGFCFMKTRFSNLDINVAYKFLDHSLLPLQHHMTKIFFVYKQTNDRVTPQRQPYYFGGYWELPNNRVANANGVTRRNPGSGWRTDFNPIE